MRILLLTHTFRPNVGGIETMSEMLAEEFAALGHEVRVVTPVPGDNGDEPYRVVRQPSRRELLAHTRWCDVFFQNNISLQTLWPLLLIRRPWVVAHHTWIHRTSGRLGLQDRAKRLILQSATQIAVSQAVAGSLPGSCTVIGNGYRNHLFRTTSSHNRSGLVFVGRLVSDKGAHLAIEALHHLARRKIVSPLTFIGSGPEEEHLKRMVKELGLERQVTFAGTLSGEGLVQEINRHQIMLVPSVWEEPFGLVALEGAACGCWVIGSDRGGLPDAIGPCGQTFPSGDAAALADRIANALSHSPLESDPTPRQQHLARHSPRKVAEQYLEVFEEVLR